MEHPLREKVARAIYAARPDCKNKPWPIETDEQRRAYPHNPIAAVDLSYAYADAALAVVHRYCVPRYLQPDYHDRAPGI